MIKKILNSIDDISMTNGRFFTDKNFKFDTVFFVARYIFDYIDANGIIDLNINGRQDEMYNKICYDFRLPDGSEASNRNYIREGIAFLEYGKVIEQIDSKKYKVLSMEIFEFITTSIENTYIFQYLVAYKTFVNDDLWGKYKEYLVATPNSAKEDKLQNMARDIANKASSVDETNVDDNWANSVTKFAIMVLALANDDYPVSRTLTIQTSKITPKELSANVAGTRSTTTKDNFYTNGFRVKYVRSMLAEYLGKPSDTLIANTNFDSCTRLEGGENVILYGVPGAGKSWTIKNEYCSNDALIERLVFHPDYTYSDFVGQILPQLDENSNVSYKFTPGPFTKILKKAYRDPSNHYYLVIEEVNRGNAPAIFGDVFQLLDRNGKGASEYSITNSDVATEVYGDANHKVSLPSNLSILGTMNTSDQNVFTLDTAFQRRWSMRLIENKFDKNNANDVKFAGTKILDTDVTWEKFFTEINTIILNKNIRMTSSEDKRLGTHFIQIEDLAFDKYDGTDIKLKTVASKHNRKFAEKVLKYLWDDAFKFNKDEIFDIKEMNSLEKVISTFMGEKGNKRFEKILKQNIYDALVPKQTN